MERPLVAQLLVGRQRRLVISGPGWARARHERPYPCRVRPLLHRRFWGAHLLVVAGVIAAVLLGVWQMHVWQAGRDASERDLTRGDAEGTRTA